MCVKKGPDKDRSAAVEPFGAAPFQTGRVVGMALCHFINDVYTSFLSPLLPLLIQKLSMSLTQAGFLSTVLQIPSLLNPYRGEMAGGHAAKDLNRDKSSAFTLGGLR